MPIFEKNNFRFRQSEVQSRGGLCCGISLALLTDLAEMHHEQNLILSATRSFYRAKEYSEMIKASRNILMNHTLPSFTAFRQRIINLQLSNETKNFNKINDKYIRGAVLLKLSVGSVENRKNAGTAFNTSNWDYAQNHMGLAVFDGNGDVFVFDPNCGGALVNWVADVYLPTPVKLVDSILLRMYRLYDRVNGKRTASLKRFECLNYNELPFGDSVI
ncbi:TPA: hypothetical protein IBI59_004988 [Escherichia coli]|nr:hypothetical protein [Escherichia coli]HAM3245562.1 hypothetical protein [Escherichia coli]